MYILSAVLFLISGWFTFVGWKAMMSENYAHLIGINLRRRAGIFGIIGAVIMATAGYILANKPNIYVIPRQLDSHGCGYIMIALAVVTFAMCGLTWFSNTKFAFWVDNRRWPTDEENAKR